MSEMYFVSMEKHVDIPESVLQVENTNMWMLGLIYDTHESDCGVSLNLNSVTLGVPMIP